MRHIHIYFQIYKLYTFKGYFTDISHLEIDKTAILLILDDDREEKHCYHNEKKFSILNLIIIYN